MQNITNFNEKNSNSTDLASTYGIQRMRDKSLVLFIFNLNLEYFYAITIK
jgi:hypothetical protein